MEQVDWDHALNMEDERIWKVGDGITAQLIENKRISWSWECPYGLDVTILYYYKPQKVNFVRSWLETEFEVLLYTFFL